LAEHTLKISYSWKNPVPETRKAPVLIIDQYVISKDFIKKKFEAYHDHCFSNRYVIGIHIRDTDVTCKNEFNIL